jgi:FkbM family methyltransferase
VAIPKSRIRNFLADTILFPAIALNLLAHGYAGFLSFLLGRRLSIRLFEFEDRARQKAVHRVVHTSTDGNCESLLFHTPNIICQSRAVTFSQKEPETLAWIDKYGGEGVFWDIGANIGLYSIYYAKTKPGPVFAFDPSVFNLEQLAKNVDKNGLYDRITIVPIALAEHTGIDSFSLSSLATGAALSGFGTGSVHGFEILESIFRYRTVGVSGDDLIAKGLLPDTLPRLIKVDVDGIEHLILAGMQNLLLAEECRSVLVEVGESSSTSAQYVKTIMIRSGFTLVGGNSHASDPELAVHWSGANQLWVKEPSFE